MSQEHKPATPPTIDKGGLGGGSELTRADLVIIGKAIRAEWKIPALVMDALPGQIAKMYFEAKGPRAKQAAARLLIQMAAENRATAHLAIQATQGQAPVIELNGNVNIDTGTGPENRANRVADVVDELRRIGLSFGVSEPEVQPAPSDAEAGSVPNVGETGSTS